MPKRAVTWYTNVLLLVAKAPVSRSLLVTAEPLSGWSASAGQIVGAVSDDQPRAICCKQHTPAFDLQQLLGCFEALDFVERVPQNGAQLAAERAVHQIISIRKLRGKERFLRKNYPQLGTKEF